MSFQTFADNHPTTNCWCKIRCKDGQVWDTYWSVNAQAFCFYGQYAPVFNEWVVSYDVVEEDMRGEKDDSKPTDREATDNAS